MAMFGNKTAAAAAQASNVVGYQRPQQQAAQNQQAQGSNQNGKQPRPKAEFYLNPGRTLPIQMEDGTVEPMFVSFPFGLELDTMSDAVPRGQSKEAAFLAQTKNALRDLTLSQCADLRPGESKKLSFTLEWEVRRRGHVEVAPDQNPMLAALEQLLLGEAAAAEEAEAEVEVDDPATALVKAAAGIAARKAGNKQA